MSRRRCALPWPRLTGLPVLRALRLRTLDDLPLLDEYALAGATLLLDTPTGDGSYGGTGQTGDWRLAAEAARRWPIILAGGLTPDNLAEALARSPRAAWMSAAASRPMAPKTRRRSRIFCGRLERRLSHNVLAIAPNACVARRLTRLKGHGRGASPISRLWRALRHAEALATNRP